ncbi:MAG: hypothetical protein R3E92_03970 [Burkholderiaceae bacterium]
MITKRAARAALPAALLGAPQVARADSACRDAEPVVIVAPPFEVGPLSGAAPTTGLAAKARGAPAGAPVRRRGAQGLRLARSAFVIILIALV